MATTTPNFGWPVPTSSDLVKNGATAIEGLGDAIDASLLDLKGGTTGQVLAKTSGTDMDFTWTTSSAGMTNPMTTTGDTIYSSSGSTPARLGIGSTGQVLTVASGVPSWATPSGGSFTTGAYNNGGQQSTTSTSYTNLATTDALTVTTGTKALVSIMAGMAKTGSATPDSWVSFAVSGATTLAAANNPYGIQFQMSDAVGGSFQFSGVWVVTGLTAGSNTFTLKYKDAGGGTTYFNNRSISVVNLGS